jgi:hypothetical protein
MQRRHSVFAWFLLCVLVLGCAAAATAQVNTATLSGTVTDPQGLAVKGAKVTLTNTGTGAERTVITDDNGRYNVVGLPPGTYKMTVDGGAGFAVYENASVVLTVGENGSFDPRLDLKGVQQTVTITTEAAPIETTKTETSETITQRRIDNLPINGRNYVNFTLTNSQTTRDMSPTIGPAPNSGLNIGGARARGTAVSVDGVDFVDNSINGIRSTLSQEGVQEFQLILSNYNAEYGRASGGVINIVTKSGGNEFHGDVFGYFRNKSFQARNAFSGQVDQATGALDPVKQAYTRVQTGATLGGALKKDKTFIFGSYEYTQREETGFSSIGVNNFGLNPYTFSFFNGGNTPLFLTPAQDTAVNAVLAAAQQAAQAGQIALAQQLGQLAGGYAVAMGSASNVALFKTDFGAVAAGLPNSSFTPTNPGPGAQFPLPVVCPPGQMVNALNCNGSASFSPTGPVLPVGIAPLPVSFVGLNSIRGNFPVMEKTSLWSARLDQRWDNRNSSFLRVGVSPSLVTGIEPATQNAVFGENAGSRAGLSQTRDLNFTFQHDTIVSDKAFNEFRMQVSRRGIHFGFSPLPGGDQVGVNIPGTAFFGREPYSPVDRIERRFQFADQVSVVRGNHSFKMGGDFNLVQLRSKKSQIFQLDFGGDITFGGLPASAFVGTNCVGGTGSNCAGGIALPGTTGLQSYGLGIPSEFIQGIGTSNAPFDNIPISLFWQDNWRVNRKLALNYGVRYDVEISPLFAPATPLNAAAEKGLGVIEGIPRDTNNVAPRIGLAWDPAGDGKTVVRAGYGLFYDHPLLAVAFDATTADGGRSVQLLSPLGLPSACGLIPPNPGLGIAPVCGTGLDFPTNLNPASIFQGVLNANSIYTALPTSVTLAYKPAEQRFDPFAANSLFANQAYLAVGFPLALLPFTLPVRSNFVYGYAEQVNASVEREIAGSWRLNVGYQRTRGLHLNKPVDINFTDPQLLAQNAANAGAAGLSVPSPILVVAPSSSFGATSTTCGVNVIAPSVLGQLTGCPGPLAPLTGQYVSTPAFFNYFRRSGPNPSFAGLVAPTQPLPVGYATQVFLAGLAGYPTGFGVPVPFNSVDAQTSEGNSWYNALTVNVTKRFTKGFELLSSYTWSHSIDDSTDLQSTLEPQDSRFPFLERGNSDNDQRHRWVTSAVIQSAASKSGDSFFRQFVGNFTLSPLVELASGRPYNIITDVDTRLSLAPGQARPSIISGSTGTTSQFIPGVTFGVANLCLTNSGSVFSIPGLTTIGQGCDGNLARNRFVLPKFFQWDLRVSKRIPFGERVKMDLIADGFNLFNRTNISAVNQVCDPSAGPTCAAGQPTAAYDARQFQFALKMSW